MDALASFCDPLTGEWPSPDSVTQDICQCVTPTLAILGLNTSPAFVKTASTTSAAVIEAYFFERSELPAEEKQAAPFSGSKMLFLSFLSRSYISSSSSFWITSLAHSKMVCSLRPTFEIV